MHKNSMREKFTGQLVMKITWNIFSTKLDILKTISSILFVSEISAVMWQNNWLFEMHPLLDRSCATLIRKNEIHISQGKVVAFWRCGGQVQNRLREISSRFRFPQQYSNWLMSISTLLFNKTNSRHTRSSAAAEGPRDALCQSTSRQLLHNCREQVVQ